MKETLSSPLEEMFTVIHHRRSVAKAEPATSGPDVAEAKLACSGHCVCGLGRQLFS